MLLVDDFIHGSGSLQVVTKKFVEPLREKGWPCLYLVTDKNLLRFALWDQTGSGSHIIERRNEYVLRLHRWASENLQNRVHLFLREGFVILHSKEDAALFKLFDPQTNLQS